MTRITRYRPVNGLFSLPRELDRWMDEALGTPAWGREENLRQWLPTTDVSETPEHLTLRLEIPGMAREDVKLSVEDDVLTVRGQKRQETSQENENFLRSERAYGMFERSFTLPAHFDRENVTASMEKGVLTIQVPRREEARARDIQIESGEGQKEIAG